MTSHVLQMLCNGTKTPTRLKSESLTNQPTDGPTNQPTHRFKKINWHKNGSTFENKWYGTGELGGEVEKSFPRWLLACCWSSGWARHCAQLVPRLNHRCLATFQTLLLPPACVPIFPLLTQVIEVNNQHTEAGNCETKANIWKLLSA